MSGVLIRRIPRTRQPQERVGIDWSNPLTAGLRLAVNGATPHTELTDGRPLTGNVTRVVSPAGVGFAGQLEGIARFGGASRTWMVWAQIPVESGGAAWLIAELRPAWPWTRQSLKLNATHAGAFVGGRFAYGRIGDAGHEGGLEAIGANQGQLAWWEATVVDGAPRTLEMLRDGALLGTADLGVHNAHAGPLLAVGTGAAVGGALYLALGWARILTAAERAQVRANPWQLFTPIERRVYLLPAASGALAGAATAASSAAGTLSVQVPLAGAALAVSSAAGTALVTLPLSGAAASASLAAGVLTVNVPLSGAALATAAAAGALSVAGGAAVALAGSAFAAAAAAGTLELRLALSGAALTTAAAAGALSVAAPGVVPLAGAAAAGSAAAGTLRVQVPIAGAALVLSSATGALLQSVPLAGAAAVASSATGGLDVSVRLSGAAAALASASGTLSLRVQLAGAAVATAAAVGTLSGGADLVLQTTPGWVIASQPRSWTVAATGRRWTVAATGRRWRIP